ncbi:MAG: 50S ribosomal protein L24 [Deltaproteobacteria bacterium]|nr:50S ribosomal protein L24 [Deltaproteobacteria bacterium]
MQKIRKGDTVQVMSGADKGKKGKVLEVFGEDGKVQVEDVFVQKRHLKPGKVMSQPNGGIIDRAGKIDISKVEFYSEKLGRPVRVGIKTKEDGSKVRVAKGRGVEGVELD